MSDDMHIEPPIEIAAPRQTLFQINETLAQLLAVRSDMLTSDPPEDTSAIDGEIIAYFQKEVAKADNIIPFWRHLETTAQLARAEAARLEAYARDLEGQLDHLKLRVKEVMIQFEKKAIPGSVGRMSLKGNGGVAPIQVQEDMLPDELCKWEGTIYGSAWQYIPKHFRERVDVKMKRLPSNTLVRAALTKPCEQCEGKGKFTSPSSPTPVDCSVCDGDGKARVPGARLLPRGSHVEVK